MCVYTPFPGLADHDNESDIALPPRVIDLASTFPLLFFMLLSNSGSLARRLQVINLAQEGKSLSDVATAYSLPLCLRRIAPDACTTALPWVDWSASAAHQLANHIPEGAAETGNWLTGVFYAARNCHEGFALWLARQRPLFGQVTLDTRLLMPLALYAWHSTQSDGPLASINVTPWSQQFGLPRAMDEADAWLSRLHMLTLSGSYPIADCWLKPGSIGHYDFVPITTYDQLISERVAMQNCLHTYVDRVADGTCRVFAVKTGGCSVATLELNRQVGSGIVHVAQLKGPGNVKAPAEILAAARLWAESQDERLIAPVRRPTDATTAARLADWLKPYRSAIGQPDRVALPSAALLRTSLGLLRRHLVATARMATLPTGSMPAGTVAGNFSIDDATAARIRLDLRMRVGEDVYQAWFRSLEFDSFDGATVRTSVPVRFLRSWINEHFLDALRASCAVAFPGLQGVEIEHRRHHAGADLQPPMALFAAVHAVPHQGLHLAGIDRIMAVVSERYRITHADIVSERRQRDVVRARQVGMYLAHALTTGSLPDIGRRFGNRDHTTVLNAIRRIEQLIEGDVRFRAEMEELRRIVQREPRR